MTSVDDVSYALSAVRAYQEDLDRIGERPFLRSRSVDGRWLGDSIWLERRASIGGRRSSAPAAGDLVALRTRFRARRLNAMILEGSPDLEPGVSDVLQRAEEMEASGGLQLASSLISSARVIWFDLAPFGATLALVQMGRIARTLGHHATASALYANAERDARRIGFGAARSRALMGEGAIHHEAGRLDAARARYRIAAQAARDVPVVRSMAWLGLSSIAHREGDVAQSLTLCLRALLDAPELPGRRAEVLVNIAYAALRAGRSDVALDAARWVLRHRVHERLRCLAIAAAALAGARLRRSHVVRWSVALARRETSASSLPYPVALMWAFVARADADIGLPQESRAAARRARSIAQRHGFVGIETEANRLLPAGLSTPAVSGELIERLQLALADL